MNQLEEMMQDEQMQFECAYHNYLMECVFGEINPMLYNETNPDQAKKLFKKVGALVEQQYNKEVFQKDWIAENRGV